MTDDRWWWWAGRAEDVDAEGIYEHGECATRAAVIDTILPHLDEGEMFVVVEAQFDQQSASGGDEFSPFKSIRNQEFLLKQDGAAVLAPPEDAAG